MPCVRPADRLAVGWIALGAGLICVAAGALRGAGVEADADRLPLSPIEGSLVICGGGSTPPEVARQFISLAGGEAARLVIVTTASQWADTPQIARSLASWRQHRVASLHILHTRSREVADSAAFCEPLARATGVWFIGGDQSRIAASYLGTQTERKLHELLRRGGVIGGTSAGAAIMSRVMIQGGSDYPELGLGLGFLPGTIVDQHFLKRQRQTRLINALRAEPSLLGLGIDERTALVVEGANLRVVGDSAVCVFSLAADEPSPQMQVLRPGDQTSIAELCQSLRRSGAAAALAAE